MKKSTAVPPPDAEGIRQFEIHRALWKIQDSADEGILTSRRFRHMRNYKINYMIFLNIDKFVKKRIKLYDVVNVQ